MKNLRIGNPRVRDVIIVVAPLSFAVYVIHTQSVVHTLLWEAVNKSWPLVGNYALPLYCVSVAVAVFIIGVLLEFIRVRLAHAIAAYF